MEMTTVYIWGTIGALFCLIVGVMLGYVRCEAQNLQAYIAVCKDNDRVEDKCTELREILAATETNLAEAGRKWKYADQYRKAIVEYMVINHIWDFDIHGDDPMAMMAEIIKWEVKMALDPVISKPAKNLHTAGVRKGAKRGRAQMQKLMQKSIDNQAATIHGLDRALFESQGKRQIFKEAVLNVLNDKVALPGVRKSLREAINVECERLRIVSLKQGA